MTSELKPFTAFWVCGRNPLRPFKWEWKGMITAAHVDICNVHMYPWWTCLISYIRPLKLLSFKCHLCINKGFDSFDRLWMTNLNKTTCGTMRMGYASITMNLQIVLNTQKIPYLNQATPKNTCQIFLPKQMKNFKPKKFLWSSLTLEIWSTPPPWGSTTEKFSSPITLILIITLQDFIHRLKC